LGVGYYYAGLSPYLKDSLAPELIIGNEQGWELFYNFAVTRWLVLGADLQIITPVWQMKRRLLRSPHGNQVLNAAVKLLSAGRDLQVK